MIGESTDQINEISCWAWIPVQGTSGRSSAVGTLGSWGQMRISFICAHSITLCPSSGLFDLTHLPNLCMKKSNSCTSTLSLELSLPQPGERDKSGRPRGPSRRVGDLSRLQEYFSGGQRLGSWWERNTGKSEEQRQRKGSFHKESCWFVSDQSALTRTFVAQGLVPPSRQPASKYQRRHWY